MMLKKKTLAPIIENLESRTLLSGAGWSAAGLKGLLGAKGPGAFGGNGGCGCKIEVPASVADDPAVQADVAAVQADKDKLAADKAALGPTLLADLQAIRDAIKAVDTSALRDQLKTDAATWRDTIKADRAAIKTDIQNGDDAQLALDKQKLTDDKAASKTALQADLLAIKDAFKNDAAVIAAKAQYETDLQPIKDDKTQLQTDCDQLKSDIDTALAALPASGDTGDDTDDGDVADHDDGDCPHEGNPPFGALPPPLHLGPAFLGGPGGMGGGFVFGPVIQMIAARLS